MKTQEGTWHWNVQRILGIAVACGLLWVSGVNASAQTYLYNRADFPTGKSPSAVVTADFNGDGIPDLAVANQTDNTVSILLGKSSGGFAAHVDYATGASPVALVAADFNGDGKLDLAIVNSQANTVSILIGNGDGTFGNHTDYAVGNKPIAIVAADFNGDKKTDLAIANETDNSVSVLIGHGDGTFEPQQTIPVAASPTSLASGDFNGDGKPDLVTSSGAAAAVSVLLGHGDGTFTRLDSADRISPTNLAAPLAVGDFNGDNHLDVVVVSPLSDQLYLLAGNGDGTFQTPVAIQLSFQPVAVFSADVNNDGKLDLLVTGTASYPSVISVLLGNGDGTFQQPLNLGINSPAANSLAIGDFNGDGRLDLAAPNVNFNSISVMLGNGGGAFGTESDVALMPINATGPSVAADFNGDGKSDLAVVQTNTPTGIVSILLGNGDGTFQTSKSSDLDGQGADAIVAGDFNGDGKLDLALLGPTISVLLGNGDGTFQAPVDTPISANLLSQAFVAADFNGDGKADLAFASRDNSLNWNVNILLSTGNGSFQTGASYPIAGATGASLVAADFNHDGKVDLAFVNGSNTLSVMLGNGNGTFQSPVSYSIPQGISVSNCLIAADFNGDGKLDLGVGTSSGLLVFLGNGDGTFRAPVSSATNYDFYSMIVGDFNGDGKTDVAASILTINHNSNIDANVVLFGNGDGTFLEPAVVTPTGPAESMAAADFNSDGIFDLALSNRSLLYKGPAVASIFLSAPVAAVCPGSLTADPGLVCSPELTFPNTNVGLTSGDSHDVVVLSNGGNAPLDISSTSATGDFAVSGGTCGTKLAVGGACQVGVSFSPTSAGNRTGELIITDNATPNPQSVALMGLGIAPVVSLSATSLNFNTQALGTTSAAQAVMLTNTGNATLHIISIGYGGDFAETNTCGASVAAGANCTISVTFTPTALGVRTSSISIEDDGNNSPITNPPSASSIQNIALTGTGLSAAVVSLSPTSLNFGGEIVGGTTAAQSIALKNTGTAALGITSIAANGDFTATNNCGASVAANASCAINITFNPAAGGSRTGTVTITDNAPGSPQTAALQGSGQDFSFSVPSGTPTSASISPGGTATYSINIAGVGGLNGAVTFACTGAPSGSTCVVSPGSLTPGSTASTLTVTVTTAAPSSLAPLAPPGNGKVWRFLALGLLALLLVVFGWPARRRPSPIALWRRCLALSAALMLILGMAACGGGGGGGSSSGGGNPGTPAGAYTLTVSGSVTEASTTVTHNMSLTLNVQ